jgi:hypothetical protein
MVFDDGKTQEVDRRQPECDFATQQRGVGSIQNSSRLNGADSHGAYSPGRSRQDSCRTNDEPEAPPGKSLERLEFIENAYFSYVDGHQRDLETRLLESKQQKQAFKTAVQELKREIYDLVSDNEQYEQNE